MCGGPTGLGPYKALSSSKKCPFWILPALTPRCLPPLPQRAERIKASQSTPAVSSRAVECPGPSPRCLAQRAFWGCWVPDFPPGHVRQLIWPRGPNNNSELAQRAPRPDGQTGGNKAIKPRPLCLLTRA